MNAKRLKAVGKLGVLFGIPLSLVMGLFCGGVYFGVEHRYAIAKFERDWLRLDVEVPDPPAESTSDGQEAEDEPEGGEGADERETGDEDRASGAGHDPPTDRRKPTNAGDRPPPAEPPPVQTEPSQTRADPLQGGLADRLALPVTTHVKVLVDQELIDQQPAWIDYVQRTVSQASLVYDKQFGIELELVSVGRWPVATDGMSAQELLEDLETRSREGADVLLGFTNRPLDGRTAGKGETPTGDSPFNGAYGVVYATPRHQNAHLRTLLHEVGHMFGALDIVDPENPDWRAGSWMSYAPVGESQAPWIDAENRRRILERKDKPFRPEADQE